jgi:dTMP kinase
MAGLFITFEGLDGSGKTTHLRRIADRLTGRGIACEVTHEPGGTPLGDALRRVFLDPQWGRFDGIVELLVVFASRRQHLLEVIDPALAAGRHVLCDRFTDSTHAYQGAGRGLSAALIEAVDRVATGGRVPDRTLLFDLPAEAARLRGHSESRLKDGTADRLDAEELAFYQRVREGYLRLAEREPQRIRVIDSSGDKEHTARQVEEALADLWSADPGADATADPTAEAEREAT